MQFRKFIPAVAACVLAVVLSMALFLNASPKVSAADAAQTPAPDFNQSISGVLYGTDSTIYPYTCTMVISNVNNPNLEGEYEIVCCYMDLWNKQNGSNTDFELIECYTEAVFYYPELNQYAKWTDFESKLPNGIQSPLFVGMGCVNLEDVDYYDGYLVNITSVFLVDSQYVTTLTWQREQ